ncbi:hypothetical protein ACWEKR_08665 [Nocardia sp. NPDC004573]|uniref:hypothetical protein n=1 Tax=Nocardia TaxID=1817 RepID=UPI0012F8B51F|nr:MULTISPECIES: hypothetical protein [Nocardia]
MSENPTDRPAAGAGTTMRDIELLVTTNTALLRRTTRALDLERFALEHGLDDPAGFQRFVRVLRSMAGVDYEAVRALNIAQKGADPIFAVRAVHGPRLALWCAGTRAHFTVIRSGGEIVWRDRHPPDATVKSAAQAAESAALQAIRVAGQTCRRWDVDAAALRLTVARSHGLDLAGLYRAALAANLLLEIVTDPVRNPAARASSAPRVEWRGSDLLSLTDPDHDPDQS